MNKLISIANVLRSSPSRVAVVYGSYSGNTERLAGTLHSELKWRLGLEPSISSLSQLDFNDIGQLKSEDTLLFLLSTYSEGGPTPSTRRFWNCIFNRDPISSPLNAFNYSLLSRGSSLYDSTFARAGIKIDHQLAKLGAHKFAPCGIQDKTDLMCFDQFFQWKESVITRMMKKYGISERKFQYTPSILVQKVPKEESVDNKVEPIIPNLVEGAKIVPITVKNLFQTERDYVYAELYLPGYVTGSHAAIWPSNSDESVNRFLRALLGDDAHKKGEIPLRVTLKNKTVITNYRLLAKHTIDINGHPDRELLLKLISLAPSDMAAKHLRKMIHTHINGTLTDVMVESSPHLPWCENLPPSALLDMFPALHPRRYSISTSSKLSPDWAGISAVVEHDPKSKFWGVASGQLYSIANGMKDGKSEIMAISEVVKDFMLPEDPKTPLILVSAGTGVAPFIGFLQERSMQKDSGPILIFTGTRTPEDLIHRDHIDTLISSGKNITHVPAYSRVDKDHSNYGYFASQIEKYGSKVYEMIENGAHIYVCGDIRKVRRGVRNTVANIIAKKLGLTPEQGQQEWKKLKVQKRLHIELW